MTLALMHLLPTLTTIWSRIRPWFVGFGSGVAFLTAYYTFYKNFLEKAKISIFPGDRINIVCWSGPRRFHLRGVLVNDAIKMGTLQHLEAEITSPNGAVQRYLWNEFVEVVTGSLSVQSGGRPLPISVPGKDGRPLTAQLELTGPNAQTNWPSGQYRVEVFGWVNRKGRKERSNIGCVFHFNIASTFESVLPGEAPKYNEIAIQEWSG